ncbi:hypothetical protein ACSQ67_010368 [Phaseolus vulgaris]
MRGSSSMASTKTNLFPPNSWIATPNLDSWTYREAFYYTQNPDIVLYRAILRNVYQFGEYDNTLILYKAMGRWFMGEIVRLGLDAFHLVGRTLVELYDMNGIFNVDEPVKENMSIVELNLLKTGQALHSFVVVSCSCGELTVNTALLSISGFRPDFFTAIPAISSITQLKYNEWGKQMHVHVIRNGSDYRVSIHNSLIDMYSACDDLNLAQKIFGFIMNKTVVSWSAMIKGYTMHDQPLEALSLLLQTKLSGLVNKGKEIFKEMVEIYGYQPCREHHTCMRGKWDKVARMRSFLRDRGLKKTPGCSWLELNGQVHEFRVADKSHQRWEDIYSILNVLELEAGDMEDDLELFDPSSLRNVNCT